MELPRSSAPRSNGWFMDVALEVYRGHTIVQRGALIQQSLTKGSQTCPACIVGLLHIEFSRRFTHEPCLFRVTFQRVVPANAGTHTARNLVLALAQRPFFTFEARGDGSQSLPS